LRNSSSFQAPHRIFTLLARHGELSGPSSISPMTTEVDASGSLEMLNRQMKNWRLYESYRKQAEQLRVKKEGFMRRQPKAQILAPLAGNRGFESTSLHQRVWCEPGFLQICGAVHTLRRLARLPIAGDDRLPGLDLREPAKTPHQNPEVWKARENVRSRTMAQ
jgi:hypothetical protein